MAEHDPAAFELIFLSETAWRCLHWRQLFVYVCARECVRGVWPGLQNSLFPFCKARAVQCVCVCVSMMEEKGVTQT